MDGSERRIRSSIAGRGHGYTLIESLGCLAVVAVVTTWGVPSFAALARDSARTRQVNQFAQAIYLARSEAIKRNGVVSLCPSRDARTCAPTTDWRTGWIVFVNDDADSPAARDPDESLLRVYPAWPAGHVVANRTTLSFRPLGQSGVTATIAFCDDRGAAAARAVIISQTGRPRIASRTSSGGALPCP